MYRQNSHKPGIIWKCLPLLNAISWLLCGLRRGSVVCESGRPFKRVRHHRHAQTHITFYYNNPNSTNNNLFIILFSFIIPFFCAFSILCTWIIIYMDYSFEYRLENRSVALIYYFYTVIADAVLTSYTCLYNIII